MKKKPTKKASYSGGGAAASSSSGGGGGGTSSLVPVPGCPGGRHALQMDMTFKVNGKPVVVFIGEGTFKPCVSG